MALIKCPECNNPVSDTTNLCPHCGYSIQRYVVERNRKLNAQINDKVAEEERKLETELRKIDNMKIPEEPKLSLSWAVWLFGGFALFFTIMQIYCVIVTGSGPGFVWFMILVAWALTAIGLYAEVSSYQAAKNNYDEIISDFDGYKKKLKRDKIKIYDDYIRHLKSKDELSLSIAGIDTGKYTPPSQGIPKCPTCGSTDLTKYGAGVRAIDGAVYGKLSVEGRAQFRCNKCGYMW